MTLALRLLLPSLERTPFRRSVSRWPCFVTRAACTVREGLPQTLVLDLTPQALFQIRVLIFFIRTFLSVLIFYFGFPLLLVS